ncbi:MAG: HAD family phosphatase [Alphaproteobacteria bacterium]|nr:MAG: HAD family phosphatase [Alphaproteobacteria bacterium]
MKSFSSFPAADARRIDYVLCDMDDTLTLDGQLPAASYRALEALTEAGVHVVVVTGRPAGWCDMMARFWPISGVVGENGAFYYRYDHENRRMIRTYEQDEAIRATNMAKLNSLYSNAQAQFPGFAISADQPFRVCDLAIDFCEDVAPQEMADVVRLRDLFEAGGATAKISSIHVNAWFGDFDKLSMSARFFEEVLGKSLGEVLDQTIYVGDSPNDEPMFARFPHSIGVANVAGFVNQMTSPPNWVTSAEGGHGFREIADHLLRHRSS